MLTRCTTVAALFICGCQAVTNSHEVLPHQYPSQAAIYTKFPLFGMEKVTCGGVIIYADWILTSAQCISKWQDMVVKVGMHKLSVKEPNPEVRSVKRFHNHSQYKKYRWSNKIAENDVALLNLDKPLTGNEYVSPIALPKPGVKHTGVGYLIGWRGVDGDGRSDTLQDGRVFFLDSNTCTQMIKKEYRVKSITNDLIWTGTRDKLISACCEDLGGPVVQYQADGSPQLVGIVSWYDSSCCDRGFPTVYTRVSAYFG